MQCFAMAVCIISKYVSGGAIKLLETLRGGVFSRNSKCENVVGHSLE